VFALTRHDVQEDGSIKLVDSGFAHGCQDAWIFSAPLPLDKIFARFSLGAPGCDNRIAYELISAGYKVTNPSIKIVARHLDLAEGRDILGKNIEYKSTMTEENIKKGLAVPPPYQHYLYPVDQIDPDSFEMYRENILHLTKLGEQLLEQEQQIIQQYRQSEGDGRLLETQYRQLDELKIQCEGLNQHLNSVLNSWSWKITKPVRKIGSFFRRMVD
jgi:hypothetical protein